MKTSKTKIFKSWKRRTTKIPKSWRDLTLKQFIELQALPKTKNKITQTIQRVAVLTGKTDDEIREYAPAQISYIVKRINFLDKLPREKKQVFFYHKWKLYKRDKLDYTTANQVTEILQLNANEKNVGAKILNVLAVIYYRGKKDKYDADRFTQIRGELESLDFITAWNTAGFFLTGLTTYLPNALRRYSRKLTTGQLENLTNEVENIESLKNLSELKILTSGTIL
jgi:hypothetical protein